MSRLLSGIAAALFFVATAHAQSNSRLDEIVHRGTLRVGMTSDYLLFSFFDKATR